MLKGVDLWLVFSCSLDLWACMVSCTDAEGGGFMQKATRLKASKVIDALLDPYLALGMTCLLPLLECINSLVKFAQSRNVFICDFVGRSQFVKPSCMRCI
jgi:hypothetical protein